MDLAIVHVREITDIYKIFFDFFDCSAGLKELRQAGGPF